ncbi:MAG: hypothetical protein ABSF50_17825 [Burkholderiaceae bacterium]|jgi:hypothetical protein
MKILSRIAAAAVVLAALAPLGAFADVPGDHPAYLHALSDLRAARWMIEHRPGNWQQSQDEHFAVQKIDEAIRELREAAFDDGKNLNDHPPVDERPDQRGRLHAAADFLKRARGDIAREEDNRYAHGLRDRSIHHIEEALHAVEHAIHD